MKLVMTFLSNGLLKKVLFPVITVSWIFTASVAPSFALSKEYRTTLQGLKEIFVYAEDSMLKTHAELRLRQAGLKILNEDNWTKASGKPQLYISIYTGSVEVGLFQEVFLARQPKVRAWVQTWRIAVHSCRDHTEVEINRYIDKFLDEFINDYLSVNNK
jgi:hypothetical protein